jgi:hypothetical protein
VNHQQVQFAESTAIIFGQAPEAFVAQEFFCDLFGAVSVPQVLCERLFS